VKLPALGHLAQFQGDYFVLLPLVLDGQVHADALADRDHHGGILGVDPDTPLRPVIALGLLVGSPRHDGPDKDQQRHQDPRQESGSSHHMPSLTTSDHHQSPPCTMRRGHDDPASVHDSLTCFVGLTRYLCGLPSTAGRGGSAETVADGPHFLAALYYTR
jgi:hypothetical protein